MAERNCVIKRSKEEQKAYYRNSIISIIVGSSKPLSVKRVLNKFKIEHGYTLPLQLFGCMTKMDFFRLNQNLFRLEDNCSTDSIVSLEEPILSIPKETIKQECINASIFHNVAVINSENNILNQNELKTDNAYQAHWKDTLNSYEKYDSKKVNDSMKEKMRQLLSKHKNGITCHKFMEVYGNEYNSHFTFSDFGFSSIRDMAFRLPSVFYVQCIEDDYDHILFEACRRSELDIKLNDPSLFYKNIPKTILNNLSKFFNTYQAGVKLNELMILYCTEYGSAYEPLKYGYSSENTCLRLWTKWSK